MSKKYTENRKPEKAASANASSAQKQAGLNWKGLPATVGGLLLVCFCCWEFGPVLRHLAEENYFSFDTLPMNYVWRQPLGWLYCAGRFLMLPFLSQWLGGLYLAALLTLCACFIDKAWGVGCRWKGVGFVFPALLLGWASWRGYNLYLRNEPSLLILGAWLLLVMSGVVAGLRKLFGRKAQCSVQLCLWKRWGLWVAVVALGGVMAGTYTFRQNVLISCDMQNKMLAADWEGMVDDALSARQPDRSVAAYHAIALNHQGQLLEHVFDLEYDYPSVKLDSIGGMDEGVNYVAESNLHCGLIQPAYHYAMEQHVMGGPRLRYFKLMAVSSMLNGEKELCERYLHLIDKMPFQGDFTQSLREMMAKPDILVNEPTFARILQFLPREQKFEQNFRTPPFLGYNVGVLSGTDETLNTSVAAALYSKDMENIIMRAQYLQQKRTLPLSVQQALVIASFKRPKLLQNFPNISEFVQNEVVNFAQQAAPLSKDKSDKGRKAMRDALVKDWKGSYMFYYYCGNLNQTAQKQTETNVN